jgi:hypothetical protein
MVLPISTHEQPVTDPHDNWVNYSDLDKETFNGLLSVFSIVANIVTHPFTVVSMRQQAGPSITGEAFAPAQSMRTAFRDTFQSIGTRGLFRGWLPMTTMGVPSGLIYIQTVEYTRETIQRKIKRSFPELNPHAVDVIQAIASSGVANFLSLIPYVPAEVLSSRLIVQPRYGVSTWDMAKRIYTEGGTKSFFRGFPASCYVGFVASAQWWMSYSGCRRELSKIEMFTNNPIGLDMVAGCVAGCTSTVLAHPLDTIRVRIMSGMKGKSAFSNNAPSFRSALAAVIEKDGTFALFRGLKASMCQSGISSIGFAFCYEFIKRYSSSVSNDN